MGDTLETTIHLIWALEEYLGMQNSECRQRVYQIFDYIFREKWLSSFA